MPTQLSNEPSSQPRQPGATVAADEPALFSIGDLAREFGVTLRALRFYEDRGLLTPRREGLNRLYGRRDRARLKLILMGKRVGFSLVEIKEMLDLYDLKDGKLTQLDVARDRFAIQLDHLRRQRAEVDAAIGELSRSLEEVESQIEARRAQAAA